MDAMEGERGGLLETLRRLGATLLAVVRNRLELLVVELQEERVRAVNTLLMIALIVALAGFTMVTASVAMLIVVWIKFGVTGLFAASGLGLAGTLLTYWWLRIRLKNWHLLPGTLAELKKDCESLKAKK